METFAKVCLNAHLVGLFLLGNKVRFPEETASDSPKVIL